MKTYIKPETIVADMLTMENLVEGSLISGKSTVKDDYVEGGKIYTKEDNGWDDFEE